MNPTDGTFHEDDGNLPKDWPRIAVGDDWWWQGCRMRVKHIDCEKHEITLVHHSRYKADNIMDKLAELHPTLAGQIAELQKKLQKEGVEKPPVEPPPYPPGTRYGLAKRV